MARRASSKRWLRRQDGDPFVRRAREGGMRARSAFKLSEIDAKDRILPRGAAVVDLGAAPGAWSQYALERVGPKGSVLALDILPMQPIDGVTCVQGDFREAEVLERVHEALAGRPVDIVLSDMAPNLGGIRAVDQARSMHLAELALEFATEVLRPGGSLLVKVWQGEGVDRYRGDLRARFARLYSRKPEASRRASRELYLLARDYGIYSPEC